MGEAKRAKDGKYYERINNRIDRITEDSLFIKNRGRIDVFARAHRHQ